MRFLRRRWFLWTLIALGFIIVALVVIAVEPTHVIRGYIRGESFYRGRPTSYWRKEVRRDSPSVNMAMGLSMGQQPDAACVPVLAELAEDEDWEIASFALGGLANVGPDARSALPILLAMFKHPDRFRRMNAGLAVTFIIDGSEYATLVHDLAGGLGSEDPNVTYCCAIALGKIGPTAVAVTDKLKDLLQSEKADQQVDVTMRPTKVRDGVSWALKQIHPNEKE